MIDEADEQLARDANQYDDLCCWLLAWLDNPTPASEFAIQVHLARYSQETIAAIRERWNKAKGI